MSSMTVFRVCTSSGSFVMMFIPSATGVQHERSILFEPSIFTTQMPQAAHGERSGL